MGRSSHWLHSTAHESAGPLETWGESPPAAKRENSVLGQEPLLQRETKPGRAEQDLCMDSTQGTQGKAPRSKKARIGALRKRLLKIVTPVVTAKFCQRG